MGLTPSAMVPTVWFLLVTLFLLRKGAEGLHTYKTYQHPDTLKKHGKT
jgi:hypothetical protein